MRSLKLKGTVAAVATLATLALSPPAALAGSRSITFDDFDAETLFVNSDGPLRDRYASFGLHFTGPAANDGGAVLDVSSFSVTGESVPNALAFNTGVTYTATQGGGVARGPETIMFDTPIHAASIRAGQAAGGTVRLTAFDGATPVSTNFQTAQAALQTLDVAAARITSLRIEFSGTASVWDDLTWSTSPVSGDDAFATRANTALTVNAPGVLANDNDADGDALTAALTRSPSNGQVALRPDGGFTYTPNGGFSGVDSFDYQAGDGTGSGNVARVSIFVSAPIPSTVSNSWLAFAKFTKATRLRANNVLANSKIRVTCKTKRKKQQKKGCAKARTIKKKFAASRVNLIKPYRKKKLPVGTKLTVTITTSGAIGKRFTFTVRKRKVPKLTLRCLPPGGGVKRCS
jgi:hypothetical protein